MKKNMIETAFGAMAAAGLLMATVPAHAATPNLEKIDKANVVANKQKCAGWPKNGQEKCFGIAKAGMNSCAASKHPCASLSKKNNDANSWVAVPKGTCVKIVNGSLTPETKA